VILVGWVLKKINCLTSPAPWVNNPKNELKIDQLIISDIFYDKRK
jgi:hypothetical protein